MQIEFVLLILSLLFFISIIADKIGYKFGVPALLLFLAVGMLFGSDGVGAFFGGNGIQIETGTAQALSTLALCIILFSGGLDTKISDIKSVLGPGITLATLGVLLTCIVTGVIIYYIFGWLNAVASVSIWLALLMAAFSAIRLAKFNVDERQHDSFIGLATPANALFWGALCCMPYAMLAYDWMAWGLIGLSFVSCWLLNAEIPFFGFKNFKNQKVEVISFLVGCIVLIGFCVAKAIITKHVEFALFSGTAVILWYVALNILLLFGKKG